MVMNILGFLVGVVRLCFFCLHIVFGLFVGLLMFPFLNWAVRRTVIKYWSRILLFFMGVRLSVVVPPNLPMKGMLVSNHTSWVDIFVANAVQTSRFLAKSDIKSWPVFGTLVTAVGTLYVKRGDRHSIRHTNKEITEAANKGELVGLYPEGTTTDGTYLLPFKSNLLQPVIDHGITVYPVGVVYRKDGLYTPLAAYAGETSLLGSIWSLMSGFGVTACVYFCAPIVAGTHTSRQNLALAAQDAIAQQLGLPVLEAGSSI